MQRPLDYFPINDYGIIGDLHTAALINPEGGIDWLCLPYFDSASLFAKILDTNIGGTFKIAPTHFKSSHTKYISKTNILQTTFHGDRQEFLLTDFMPIHSEDGSKDRPEEAFICRQIECTKGTNLDIEVLYDPCPNYARDEAHLSFQSNSVQCSNYPIQLLLDHPVQWDAEHRRGRFKLSHGDIAHFIFYFGKKDLLFDPLDWVDQEFTKTRNFWEIWTSKNRYKGRWQRAVERSALTLKLMVFKPTGAIIAAPTTSLPESIGGERNWDYRFSWLRDSALTLEALFSLGYAQEAEAYMNWIMEKIYPSVDNMHILYPIRDETGTAEKELPHLEGYRKSKPVRIGNAAGKQFQLDVYGELLDTFYHYAVFKGEIGDRFEDYISSLADTICKKWKLKDEGIWEVRGGKKHFTHSKIMCWIGLDRAIRLAFAYGYKGNVKLWKEEKEKIFNFILEECVDKKENYLKQSPESSGPDASNLLAPILSFLPAKDTVVQNTIEKTLEVLTKNKLVYRYHGTDGLQGREGAFNICTFWLIEALTLAGRTQDAMDFFNHMLEQASYLGLYAEESEPETLESLGNFPQAFTHIGLIHAALALNTQIKKESKKS